MIDFTEGASAPLPFANVYAPGQLTACCLLIELLVKQQTNSQSKSYDGQSG